MERGIDIEILLKLKQKKRKKFWSRIVSVMMCIVVFCTTYALILPAITQETETFCGIEAHTHADDCYEQTLLCENHVHTDDCYLRQEELTCSLPESEGHTHAETCAPQTEAVLSCGMEEAAEHIHTEACSVTEQTLSCGQEESTGHTHTDACSKTESVLSCGLEESEEHGHSDGCYTTVTSNVCGQEESTGHSHTDACYTTTTNYGCGQEETAGHAHTDACYTAVTTYGCGLEEMQAHTHAEECYETAQVQTCTIETDPEHEHIESCYEKKLQCELEEHTHSLPCYADLTADLETAEVWEATLPEQLSGEYAADVLAIAQSQLGYIESTKNYIVSESGETKGYTRYGAWYGIPYGDWCAMFVSFCLDYAGVEGIPLDCNCPNWINALTEKDMYTNTEGFAPLAGDIIFFDWNSDGSSDHVGIVAEFIPATEHAAAQIKTIEGNSGNTVRYVTYNLADTTIMGYGVLPKQMTEEEAADVNRVIGLIDAMPSADEIDAKIEEFEAVEDYEGEEAWLTEVYQQVAEAYYYYDQLSDSLKTHVTNADKLLELEYIWSVTPYVSTINSAEPTVGKYTSTKDFIELNLYDYNYNINNWWDPDGSKYPGFQWNGGAYIKYKSSTSSSYHSDYVTTNSSADLGVANVLVNRHLVDAIDFGNSIISNFEYVTPSTSQPYGKSKTSTGVGKLYNNSGASATGKINWLWYDGSDYGTTTNRPVGFSTQVTKSGELVYTQSIANTLQDGYPALTDGTSLSYLFGDDDADIHDAVTKLNTQTIDGLFLQDTSTGAYSYNSRENHAQYSNNFFTRYDQIITPNFIVYPFGNFLPLNTITDGTKATQVGAFNYDGGVKKYVDSIVADLNTALNDSDTYADTSRSQLKTMLLEYEDSWTHNPWNNVTWSNLSAANAIKDYFLGDSDEAGDTPSADTTFISQTHLDNMYNIDWDEATNFFFGMDMKMRFYQPKDGMTGSDTDGDGDPDYPMEFYFTGDDDVWVYIDDVLFLDLTGIHRHVGGKIDFVNGWVYYYELDVENGGDVSSTPYAQYSFAALLRAAGWTEAEIDEVLKPINSAGNRPFKDYSTHTFNFYYMERGSGSSICRMNFNFPLLQQNTISIEKELTDDSDTIDALGNPDFTFQVLDVDANGNKTENSFFSQYDGVGSQWAYSLYDVDGSVIQEVKVTEKNPDGTVKSLEVYNADNALVRSETEDENGNPVITNYPENGEVLTVDENGCFTMKAGQKAEFVGIPESWGLYYVRELLDNLDADQYDTILVSGVAMDKETVTVGGTEFTGVESPILNMTNGSSTFRFDNEITTQKLADLSITKQLRTYAAPLAETTYKMHVELDGTPIAVGTSYTVGSETKQVTEAGIVEIAAGETAKIANILSGTRAEIWEDSGSAEGYTVSYSQTGSDEWTTDGNTISGVLRVNADVAVTVTNAEKGATVTLPGTKTISLSDGTDREFSFNLVEVTDASGAAAVPGGEEMSATATAGDEPGAFEFTISYLALEFDALPATRYYKITEVSHGDTLVNNTIYVAEVTISESDDGIAAAVTAMTKNGEAVDTLSTDFENTLTGSLMLKKLVDGGTEAQANGSFDFDIALMPGDSGVTLPTSYAGTYINTEGVSVPVEIPVLSDGTIGINDVRHNEVVIIHGIPIGAKWTITETNADGYFVFTEVTAEETLEGTSITTTGSIFSGQTQVVYTNQQGYTLPETGGAGTNLYTMAGLLLMLISSAFLLYKCKKRRREVF